MWVVVIGKCWSVSGLIGFKFIFCSYKIVVG